MMARQPEGSPVYEALVADYEHDALQTCAADGSCQGACPVAIDSNRLSLVTLHIGKYCTRPEGKKRCCITWS